MHPSDEKPVIIKQMGQMNIMFSAYLVFSAVIGLVFWYLVLPVLHPDIRELYEMVYESSFFMRYYTLFSFLMGTAGIVNIIGGIFLLRYRQWARVLVILASGMFLLAFLLFVADAVQISGEDEFSRIFLISSLVNMLMIAAPFVISIYHLSKKELSAHFE